MTQLHLGPDGSLQDKLCTALMSIAGRFCVGRGGLRGPTGAVGLVALFSRAPLILMSTYTAVTSIDVQFRQAAISRSTAYVGRLALLPRALPRTSQCALDQVIFGET